MCLRPWRNHDFLACAVSRGGSSGSRSRAEEMSQEFQNDMEERIRRNWAEGKLDATHESQESFAAEVRQRFQDAFTTLLAGDEDLIAANIVPENHNLQLGWNLVQFYEKCEIIARTLVEHMENNTTAPEKREREKCEQQLWQFVTWLQGRWWLRLGDVADSDVEDYAIGDNRRPLSDAFSSARRRALSAVRRLRKRKTESVRKQLLATLAFDIVANYDGSLDLPVRDSAPARQPEMLVAGLIAAPDYRHAVQQGAQEGNIAKEVEPAISSAVRSLHLAAAADTAWTTNLFFEALGVLRPVEGMQAQSSSKLAAQWIEELRDRMKSLEQLVLTWPANQKYEQSITMFDLRDRIVSESRLLDASRQSAFHFALEYCGGARVKVRSRADI